MCKGLYVDLVGRCLVGVRNWCCGSWSLWYGGWSCVRTPFTEHNQHIKENVTTSFSVTKLWQIVAYKGMQCEQFGETSEAALEWCHCSCFQSTIIIPVTSLALHTCCLGTTLGAVSFFLYLFCYGHQETKHLLAQAHLAAKFPLSL